MVTLLACIATAAIAAALFLVRERNSWKDRYHCLKKEADTTRGALRFAELDLAGRRAHEQTRETDAVYRMVQAGLKNGSVVVASKTNIKEEMEK